MTNKDLDNLISRINKDLEEMNYEIETNNMIYTPIYNARLGKVNTFKWFVFFSLVLVAIGAYLVSRYVGVYIWYFAYSPLFITGAIFLTFFLFFLINFKKLKNIKKEWNDALKKSNDLSILITRHSKIVRDEILERLGNTKQEVVRVIGSSLPDLIEYYEYYKDFIEKYPNEKPEVRRIRPYRYNFEKVTLQKGYKDNDVIEALSHELNKNNYQEIVTSIKNGITKGHVKIMGYIYSYSLEHFPKKITNEIYKELTENENNKNVNGINFFSFYFDYKIYNKRNVNLYLKNMNKVSPYYQLLNVIYRHHIYDLYTYNNIEPLKYLINIVMNNEVILNNYEVNELLKLIFSYALNTNLVFTNHYVNMVMNIYNHFKDILRSDTSILYFKRMVLIKLNDDKTLEAERFLNEIKDMNSQDFFYRTHVILLKYESKSFKELFKKYSYKEIKEFNELETSINASKDFELSNELYDFKRKYL